MLLYFCLSAEYCLNRNELGVAVSRDLLLANLLGMYVCEVDLWLSVQKVEIELGSQ